MRRSGRSRGAFVCALALALLLGPVSGSARAGEPALAEPPRWEILFAPYAWATAMSGDARVRDVGVDVDMSFKDILDQLNIAFFGKLQVRRDRAFVFVDTVYADLGDDVSAGPVTLGYGPTTLQTMVPVGPRGRGTALATVDIPRVETQVGPADAYYNFKLLTVDLGAGYRIFSKPISELLGDPDPEDPRRFHIDLFGGGRYWHLKPEIHLTVPPVRVPGFTVNPGLALNGPRGRFTREVDFGGIEVAGLTTAGIDADFDDNEWWIDPFLGVRMRGDVTERISLTLMGDVGGFGIGSAADLSWQATGVLGWQFAEQWTVVAGYRARGVDRDQGNLAIDLVMQGPVMGFVWRWQR